MRLLRFDLPKARKGLRNGERDFETRTGLTARKGAWHKTAKEKIAA